MSGVIGKTLFHPPAQSPLSLYSLSLLSKEEENTPTSFDKGSLTLPQVSSYGVAVATDQVGKKVLLLIYTSRDCIRVQSLCNENLSRELICNSLMGDFETLIQQMVRTAYTEEDSGFLLDKINRSQASFKSLEFVARNKEVYKEQELQTILSKLEQPTVDIYYKNKHPILMQSIIKEDHLFELIELDKSLPVKLRDAIHSIYFEQGSDYMIYLLSNGQIHVANLLTDQKGHVRKLGKAQELCSLQQMENPFNELPISRELLSLYSQGTQDMNIDNQHYSGIWSQNLSKGPQIVGLAAEEVNQGLLSNIELLNLQDQGQLMLVEMSDKRLSLVKVEPCQEAYYNFLQIADNSTLNSTITTGEAMPLETYYLVMINGIFIFLFLFICCCLARCCLRGRVRRYEGRVQEERARKERNKQFFVDEYTMNKYYDFQDSDLSNDFKENLLGSWQDKQLRGETGAPQTRRNRENSKKDEVESNNQNVIEQAISKNEQRRQVQRPVKRVGNHQARDSKNGRDVSNERISSPQKVTMTESDHKNSVQDDLFKPPLNSRDPDDNSTEEVRTETIRLRGHRSSVKKLPKPEAPQARGVKEPVKPGGEQLAGGGPVRNVSPVPGARIKSISLLLNQNRR